MRRISQCADQIKLLPPAEVAWAAFGWAGVGLGWVGAEARPGNALCPKLDGWFEKLLLLGWLW